MQLAQALRSRSPASPGRALRARRAAGNLARVTALPALLALGALGCHPPPATIGPVAATGQGSAAVPAGPELPPLLARFRAVTGGARWDAIASISTTSTITVGELAGTSTAVEDVRGGRYRTATRLAGFALGDGFDGTAAWQQTMGGEVVVLDAPDMVALAATTRWLTARGYFRADATGYRDLGSRALAERGLHVLEATPPGGAPIELWFDDATGLLAQTVHREGTETVTTTYGDYRAVDGVQLAFHIVVDPGDPRNRTDATATDVTRLGFAGGAHDTRVPFELINNHIYIHAAIDGKPVRLLVDTGGLNLVTPAAATRLGLASSGKLAAAGAGETKVDLAFARGHELAVGDVRLAEPVFYVIDLGALDQIEGEAIDGLVGFELFQRLAVRIDYPGRALTLIRRDDFVPPAGSPGLTVVPFDMRDRTPVAAGAIDDLPARFTIDTGARNSITIDSPFVRDHQLEARYHPAFETVVGWGVGGPSRGKPVRIPQIKLGDAVITDVAGDLYLGDKGAFADPEVSANIGGGLLKRFVVTFDYRDHKLYLEPAAGVPRDVYDRAGMFVLRTAGPGAPRLRVVAVTPGGAAAAAGLVADDAILAIDGAAIASRPLWAWRALLAEGKVGARHRLTVETKSVRRDRTLVLGELLP